MLGAATLLMAVAAPAAAAPAVPNSAGALVETTTRVCQQVASGKLQLGKSIDDDTRLLAAESVGFGLRNGTLERLGRGTLGLVSQSLIGERTAGADSVVLAVGGRMPGCRSILLSKVSAGQDAAVAAALVAAGWREAPASNPPGAPMVRRMFLKRDAGGAPFLVNMFSGTLPDSEIRVMTTVNPIPPGVELPKGL